jgi:hypothetical protein
VAARSADADARRQSALHPLRVERRLSPHRRPYRSQTVNHTMCSVAPDEREVPPATLLRTTHPRRCGGNFPWARQSEGASSTRLQETKLRHRVGYGRELKSFRRAELTKSTVKLILPVHTKTMKRCLKCLGKSTLTGRATLSPRGFSTFPSSANGGNALS